jgi:hypothetical protein
MNIDAFLKRAMIAGGAATLAACATAPQPPTDAFQAADISISNAEKDHAADAAPLEMRTAREKLSAARTAGAVDSDEQHMLQSRRLADEARVDAELAVAKSRLAKADAANLELQKDSNALHQEIQRGPGV